MSMRAIQVGPSSWSVEASNGSVVARWFTSRDAANRWIAERA